MKPNTRAVVIAATASLMVTLLARWQNPVTYYQSWPGRMAMRGFYSLVGVNAGRLGLAGLIALHHTLNFIAWFVVVFILARLLYLRAPGPTTFLFLVLKTIAAVLLAVAASFAVYVFVVPDPRHGNFYAMLIAIAFLIAALIPALAALVLWSVRLRRRRNAGVSPAE